MRRVFYLLKVHGLLIPVFWRMFSYYAPPSRNLDRGWRTVGESGIVKLSPGRSQVPQWKSNLLNESSQDHRTFPSGVYCRGGHRAVAGGKSYRPSEFSPCDKRANGIPKLEYIRSLPAKVKVLRYLEHVEKSRNGNSFGAPGSNSIEQRGVNPVAEEAEEWNPFKSVDVGYVSSYPDDMVEQSVTFVGSSTVDEDMMMEGSVYGAVGDHLCRYSENLLNRNVFLRSPASTSGVSSNDNSRVENYRMRMLWSSYESWHEYAPLNADICWMWSSQDHE